MYSNYYLLRESQSLVNPCGMTHQRDFINTITERSYVEVIIQFDTVFHIITECYHTSVGSVISDTKR